MGETVVANEILPHDVNRSVAHNLPSQLTSFIGRELEVAALRAILSESSLVTLTGAGGVGKTRLAIETARAMLGEYPDGVWLVELASISQDSLVPQVVANVLGITEEPGQSILTTIVRYVQQRTLLIVLDNCEHLIRGCQDIVTRLTQYSTNIKILVTSRQSLAADGEILWPVPSLSLPDTILDRVTDKELYRSLLAFDAIQLFVQRARLANRSFALNDGNADAVLTLCKQLDGVPLSIELAAARVNRLPIDSIVTVLHRSYGLKINGEERAYPRHETLSALIDWSYNLLTEPEQILLQRLSVFLGGWDIDAVEMICTGHPLNQSDLQVLLASLVSKCLVVYDDRTQRYRLLETIRTYALRLLNSGKSSKALDRRHARYYLKLSQSAEAQINGSSQSQWIDRLESEHDNLRAALAWYMTRQSGDLLSLCVGLWRFWDVRGYFSEGRRWIEIGLKIGLEKFDKRLDEVRPKALIGVGFLSYRQGDHTSAWQYLEAGRALSANLGDTASLALALDYMANLAREEADYDKAHVLIEEALGLRDKVQEELVIGLCLHTLSTILSDQGEHHRAEPIAEEALHFFHKIGDDRDIAGVLHLLGRIKERKEEYDAARRLYEQARDINRRLRNRTWEANNLHNLGLLAATQGDLKSAFIDLREALLLRAELGHMRGMAYSMEGIGELALGCGHAVECARLFGSAQSLRKAAGSPLPKDWQPAYQRAIKKARQMLGKVKYDAAFLMGSAVTINEAVHHAVAVADNYSEVASDTGGL